MHTAADNSRKSTSKGAANKLPERENSNPVSQLIDNRPEVIAQRKLQEIIDANADVKQLRSALAVPNASSYIAVKKESTETETAADKNNVIQRVKYVNKNTNKRYTVKIGASRIEAQEDGGESCGHIKFFIDKPNFVAYLLHLESFPEEGSGLGALLVFLFTMEASKQTIPFIEVGALASTALGFYAKMGFNVAKEQEKKRKQLRDLGRAEDIVEPISVPQAGATTVEVSINSSQSVFKNWTFE
ncbi:MAG: hypothetical protein M3R17_13640 [Bacteroidota bacterium]|nr:hypothetical protein [Bacteroidota bacterium]